MLHKNVIMMLYKFVPHFRMPVFHVITLTPYSSFSSLKTLIHKYFGS